MDGIFVGIDVSRDRLDVHVLPAGEAFYVSRNGEGIADLADRLKALAPSHVAVEATGGFETVVAAGLAGAGLPVVVVNPAQVRHFARALGERAKTDPGFGRSPTRRPSCWPIWWRAAGRSSR
jgi:transposase